MPRAASTAVIPISSGTPAATSVPNVIVRMISVIGSESSPAFLRSSVMTPLIALLALASPSCSMSSVGCAAWAAATAARVASTRSAASVESPAISKSTRAAWPSADTALSPVSGDLTFSTYGTFGRRSVTSATAAWNAGSLTVSSSLWMNTDSLIGRRPERSSATSARWDSPENWSTSEMFVVPIALPAMKTTTTKASQPQNAFLRCRPLQCGHAGCQVDVLQRRAGHTRLLTRAFGADRSRSTRHAGRGSEPEARLPCSEARRIPTIHPLRGARAREPRQELDSCWPGAARCPTARPTICGC